MPASHARMLPLACLPACFSPRPVERGSGTGGVGRGLGSGSGQWVVAWVTSMTTVPLQHGLSVSGWLNSGGCRQLHLLLRLFHIHPVSVCLSNQGGPSLLLSPLSPSVTCPTLLHLTVGLVRADGCGSFLPPPLHPPSSTPFPPSLHGHLI